MCIPPADYLIGLREWEYEVMTDPDRVILSLQKFVTLALRANPTILEQLWVRDCDVLRMTEAGRRLRGAREIFLSKRVFESFGGYAHAQLLKLHNGKTARHGTHAGIVYEFGFDTKNATHLIRLLRSGVELLRDGVLHTYRPDAAELLDIRQGQWSFEQILAENERLGGQLRDAYAYTVLPDEPDFEAANALVVELHRNALEGRL